MKRAFCDRCGEEIEMNKGSDIFEDGVTIGIHFRKDTIYEWNGYPLPHEVADKFTEDQKLDLCHECTKDFARFMTGAVVCK